MEIMLLTPTALHRGMEPYKRLLGILLRPTCISLSVSNSYLNLAEPAGAVLLRAGRVPERTLLKLLEPLRKDLTGVVIGSEAHQQWRDFTASGHSVESLRQVHAVLQSVSPGLPAAWWDRWAPDTPASCRITPPPRGPAQSPEVASAAGPGPGPSGGIAPAEQGGGLGGASAAGADGPGGRGSAGAGAGAAGPPCSMATLFLQNYLDSLGSLNTFG
ncbi:hypothetical protein TSOC_008361 [Tetrabaena socialis]|uniref:Uncharacterized protein n=1 Tax=Tetrabaena socialis TaxID=47790 RepID=A0A2J7ZYQ3_9CHLO|nr:hypothetical protein TSOC_008361 [Tetrabaena socialis]|eukprot:PNH05376.1 hypothetical protein TSOC_008361 [Tetrabaena socialis]